MTSNTTTLEMGEATREPSIGSMLARAFRRFTERRSMAAERKVNAYLSRYSDERLREFGFSTDKIADIRRHVGEPAGLWA